MMIIVIIGALCLGVLLYWFSVRVIMAILLWQELDEGYVDTGHPEHEAWAKAHGVNKAQEAALERIGKNAILRRYTFLYFFFFMLFLPDA